MNVYILILFLILCTFILYTNLKYSRITFVTFIILYLILISTRLPTTPDTEPYILFYKEVDLNFFDFSQSHFEIGYQLFAKLVKCFAGNNYKFFFAILVLLNVSLIVSSVKRLYSSDLRMNRIGFICISLICYISYYGIFYNGIVLRAGVSLSLLFYITSMVISPNAKYRILKIILLFILSLLFHKTAIIGLFAILIFLISKPYSRNFYFILSIIIVLGYLLNISNYTFTYLYKINDIALLWGEVDGLEGTGRIANYVNRAELMSEFSIKYIYFLALAVLFCFGPIKNEVYCKYLNVYLVGLMLLIALRNFSSIIRGLDFFLIYSFILLSICFACIKKNQLKFIICSIAVYCQFALVLRIFGIL